MCRNLYSTNIHICINIDLLLPNFLELFFTPKLLSSLDPAHLCSNLQDPLSKSQFRNKRSRADTIISVHHHHPPPTTTFKSWWSDIFHSLSSQTKLELFTWLSESFPNDITNDLLNDLPNESSHNFQNEFVNNFLNFSHEFQFLLSNS